MKALNKKSLGLLAVLFALAVLGAPRIAAHIRAERERAQEKAKIKTLNLYMPQGNFAGKDGVINYDQIAAQRDYYQKITEYFPQMAEGHEVLGICYFQRGRKEEALRELTLAVKLNPTYFWAYYNLGVVYLKEGQVGEAAMFFQKAQSLPPQLTLQTIYSSKVLSDILRAIDGAPYPVKESLQDGYKRVQILFQLCQRALQKKEPLPMDVAQIPLKIF